MEYKVRKGIETPCKIHGLLVHDFYVMLGYLAFAVLFLLLEINSWMKDGSTVGELLVVLLLLGGGGALLTRKLYGNASRKKYRPAHWEKTITNHGVVRKTNVEVKPTND